jgi:hypothetical protein
MAYNGKARHAEDYHASALFNSSDPLRQVAVSKRAFDQGG